MHPEGQIIENHPKPLNRNVCAVFTDVNALISIIESFLTQNFSIKHSFLSTDEKLFQHFVIAGSTLAVVDNALIFGVLTNLIFAFF
jgi:hypothetical protein